jgi:phenylpropionate dioxygenase-like ring-hydroxylating dioxygenase large terminal subunit
MEPLEARLAPPPTRGQISVVELPHQWFIACASGDLGTEPRAVTLQGTPVVLFRGLGGRPAALLDRCPHRNAPLSAGRVADGLLACRYHGWRFDTEGTCRAVPGLCGAPEAQARHAPAYAATEQDGFVWVYSTPDAVPRATPFRFPHLGERGYATIRRDFTMQAALFHAVENALDVPHTAYLHGGLFRSSRRPHDIEVVVRRSKDCAEAEFIGEPRPTGIVGRLLAPGGGVVVHFDRFLLPSIAQVEYRLGDHSHLVITSAMTPVTDFVTRLWVVIVVRLRMGAALVARLLAPLATRIQRQDATILGLQTETIRRFGGEQLTSTEIDVLGPQIWRLLTHASQGDARPAEAVYERRVTMRV